MSRPWCVAVLCVLLASCASAESGQMSSRVPLEAPERFVVIFRNTPVTHRVVIPVSIERAWSVVPGVFRELNYPGAPATNTQQRIYLTPTLGIKGRLYQGENNSQYFDCGMAHAGPRADLYEVHFAIIVWLRPTGDGHTEVETVVDGFARDRTVSSAMIPCTGRGRLEKAVTDLLHQRATS